MSDLYRLLDIDSDDPEYGLGNSGTMYRGRVEPVGRCEHGMIDEHDSIVTKTDEKGRKYGAVEWCDGSPTLKDDDE